MRYLYGLDDRLLAVVDASGAVQSQFIYATGRHVPDFMLQAGQLYALLTDKLGSVHLVVNTTSGAILQHITYDAWGVATLRYGSWDTQPFGFAGGLYDSFSGLVHFGAREYEPREGRWLRNEPLLFASGTNLYVYSYNDPVNWADPNGLTPVQLATAVIGAGTGFVGSVAGQMMSPGYNGDINWGNALISAGVGGVTGYLAPVLATNYVAAGALGGVSNFFQYMLTVAADCRGQAQPTLKGAAISFGVGVLAGLAGGPGTVPEGQFVERSVVVSATQNATNHTLNQPGPWFWIVGTGRTAFGSWYSNSVPTD